MIRDFVLTSALGVRVQISDYREQRDADQGRREETLDMRSPMSPLTTAGSVLGTIQYTSPEQLEGLEVDARSDIFALGEDYLRDGDFTLIITFWSGLLRLRMSGSQKRVYRELSSESEFAAMSDLPCSRQRTTKIYLRRLVLTGGIRLPSLPTK